MNDLGFLGFTELGDSLQILLQTRNPSGLAPINADSNPSYFVYGQTGLVQSGACSPFQAGTITAATNADPIVITSAGHGLVTGNLVTIAGVLGNTNANGTWVVTVIDDNTFSIPATGNGSYTSGGTWNMTGLYVITIAATEMNGYASGVTYTIDFAWTVSSANQASLGQFCVT